jgi:hypothetical protein
MESFPSSDFRTFVNYAQPLIKKPKHSYKLVLDSHTAIPGGSPTKNEYLYNVNLPNLSMEGTYNMYVDSFVMNPAPANPTIMGIKELDQTRSWSSINKSTTTVILTTFSSEMRVQPRSIQVSGDALFNNSQLTVALSQYGVNAEIVADFQLTLIFEPQD